MKGGPKRAEDEPKEKKNPEGKNAFGKKGLKNEVVGKKNGLNEGKNGWKNPFGKKGLEKKNPLRKNGGKKPLLKTGGKKKPLPKKDGKKNGVGKKDLFARVGWKNPGAKGTCVTSDRRAGASNCGSVLTPVVERPGRVKAPAKASMPTVPDGSGAARIRAVWGAVDIAVRRGRAELRSGRVLSVAIGLAARDGVAEVLAALGNRGRKMTRLTPAEKGWGSRAAGGRIRPELFAMGLRGTMVTAGRLKLGGTAGMGCHGARPEMIRDPKRGLGGGPKEPNPRPPVPRVPM